MILGQISWADIVVFLIFLAPQLLWHVGPIQLTIVALKALPFLLVKLPLRFAYEHTLLRSRYQSPFVRQASLFEDFVIRCVRYAFSNIPATVGKVFFSKPVALPFLRFRLIRHGYLQSPILWREVSNDSMKGIWIIENDKIEPDVVIYYAHGGGFSMGSSFFYLEFLLVWVSLLKAAGFRNPAIFALEYTLVPESCYPTQLHQALGGYQYILAKVADSSRIVISGDSAGATIMLSLMLHMAKVGHGGGQNKTNMPGYCVLISPWVTLVSNQDKNTPSDYLDSENLHRYARQYSGPKASVHDPALSPGNCKDLELWTKASPAKGFFMLFGAEEVLGPEMRDLARLLKGIGTVVEINEAKGGIHAWPVAALFLSSTREERLKGLRDIVDKIASNIA